MCRSKSWSHVRVDNQLGMEGVRKQSTEVAAIQALLCSWLKYPWFPTLEKHHFHHPW